MTGDAGSRLGHLSNEERNRLIERLLKNRQHTNPVGIVAQPRNSDVFPLSYAQQRIWFLHQVFPLSSGFTTGQAFRLRGALDVIAFERCVADLVARHESLRTTFHLIDAHPVQSVSASVHIPVAFEDLRSLPADERAAESARRANEDCCRPWSLTSGPLLRVRLMQIGDDEHVLLLLLHHIVCDGWSMGTLLRELTACYGAHVTGVEPTLPNLPIQYVDYAVWHRRWLEGNGGAAQLSHWLTRLTGAPVLRLPVSPASTDESATALLRSITLSRDLTRAIKAFGQSEAVTPFMTLLAAFALLLARYSGQDDIVVGSPVASRTRPELERVVGCFMNPLPFRVNLIGNPSFRALLRRVRDVALEVYANQDIPFDMLVRELEPKREAGVLPLYQVMFLLHNFPAEALAAPPNGHSGLRTIAMPLLAETGATGSERHSATDRIFPVALEMYESNDVITGKLEYAPEYRVLFARFSNDFAELLQTAIDYPDRSVEMLIASRREPLGGGFLETAAPSLSPVPDVSRAFEVQANRTPDAPAIVDGDERLTYGELAGRVNRLAAYLRPKLSGSDTPVGVLLGRSIDAVATLLAILRAGGAYVPLDPALPADRLAIMLEHVPVIVTREDVLASSEIDRRLLDGRVAVRLDLEAEAIQRERDAEPALVDPEHLAYILYTSGSSGRPKAVAIPRRALSNYIHVARAAFAIEPADRVLQFASLNFDTAAEEIFPTLVAGATLVLRNDAMLSSAPAFFAACAKWAITVVDLPTAYWHELTVHVSRSSLRIPESLRLVVLGGEKALVERVREWFASAGRRVRLFNTYGPTETTVVAAMCDLTNLDLLPKDVPLGHVIPNADAYVLLDGLEKAADGATAELCIGGAGLARGYVNDAALTAERFVPDPFGSRPGARLYRTGDLARRRADGILDFAGRLDDQIKLRGYRIEPGEIESVLAQCASIREASVMVREDHSGDRRLVAYLVAVEPSLLSVGDIRRFLQEHLPDYMVPVAFVVLDRLPRTIQQKVDRAALPAPPDASLEAGDRYVAPQTDVEQKIASIWSDVLHRNRIGILENFFDLGGHSLLMIQLHARLCELFGNDLALIDLFRLPTVESQAAHLTGRGVAPVLDEARDRAARQRQAFRRQARPQQTAATVTE